MTSNQAFPSRYLSKEDCDPPFIATMDRIEMEELDGDEGKKNKAVLYFKGDVKPWVLPRVSWWEIEALYGKDSEGWNGRQIELFHDASVMFGPKRVGGVRCRKPLPAQQPVQRQQRPATQPTQQNRTPGGRPLPPRPGAAPAPQTYDPDLSVDGDNVPFEDPQVEHS